MGKSKHIARRARFMQEAHSMGLVRARAISGEAQGADLLTKPLDRKRFVALRGYLLNEANAVAGAPEGSGSDVGAHLPTLSE